MAETRSILITGGAQGIGKAMAQRFARQGDRVFIADVDEEAGRETEAELAPLGEVRFIHMDVADEASVQEGICQVVARADRLAGLINNAGLTEPVMGRLEETRLADWDRVIGVNLTGCYLCARAAAPLLRRGRGAIVNIASTRAIQSEPDTFAYAASKGGVVALTHALAVSLGPEVRVHCVSPGWIDVGPWRKASLRRPSDLRPEDHGQHPVGRVGRPEDVAALVAFLLSDEAGFLTGQHHIIDGGMTRKMMYVE